MNYSSWEWILRRSISDLGQEKKVGFPTLGQAELLMKVLASLWNFSLPSSTNIQIKDFISITKPQILRNVNLL